MQYREIPVQNRAGDVVKNATVWVYNQGTTNAASVFDASGLALTQPLSSGDTGVVGFAADDGDYDVVVSVGSSNSTITNLQFLSQEGVAFTGTSAEFATRTISSDANGKLYQIDGRLVAKSAGATAVGPRADTAWLDTLSQEAVTHLIANRSNGDIVELSGVQYLIDSTATAATSGAAYDGITFFTPPWGQTVQVQLKEVSIPVSEFFDETETWDNGKADWTQAFVRAQQHMRDNSQLGDLVVPRNVNPGGALDNIYVTSIDLYSSIRLKGAGRGASQIRQRSDASGAIVKLADADQAKCGVIGLSFVGNWDQSTVSANPSSGAGRGIDLDNEGGSGFPQADPRHVIRDVEVLRCADLSVRIGLTARETRIDDLFIQTGGGWGFAAYTTDSRFAKVTVGGHQLKAFHSQGANNSFIDCQGYGSQDGPGWDIQGDRDRYVGCGAQDNAGSGFHIASGAAAVVIAGAVSDSNEDYAYFFDGCVGATATGLVSVSRSGGTFTQQVAYFFGPAASDNHVEGTSLGDTATTGGGGIDDNWVHVNNFWRTNSTLSVRRGTQTQMTIGQVSSAAGLAFGSAEALTLTRQSDSILRCSGGMRLNTDGSVIRSGTGVPSIGAGADGDFYFRADGTAGSKLYAKISGSWAAIA